MNLISSTILDHWKRSKTKMSPSGWLSRNAPCCHHRGQNQDKRGRGGLKIGGDGALSINCFNCGFTASFTPGKPLYPKLIKIMDWLGIDERTINQLKLESLRVSSELGISEIVKTRRDVKEIEDMPACQLLQTNIDTHLTHVEFLKTRGFTPDDFSFLVSDQIAYRSRIILPFILHDTLIGFSARSIIPQERMRYIMRTTTDFVFGLDFVQEEHEWVIVTEGLFDALSVKGLAVMHNEISDVQAEMICDLQKKIIVVPHLDYAGLEARDNSLINTALDYGWHVSIPEWDAKDINEAYVKYGPLFVVKHLLDASTDNNVTIRLKQRMLNNQIKADRKIVKSLNN